MTVYGYQRVSTKEQNLDRQSQQLVAHGIKPENIYTDKDSGGKVHRKGLDELLSKVTSGDKVVVIELSRLARSVNQLLSISEDFQKRSIELVSLKEQIDTSTAAGKLFFTISAAFSQFEKDMIQDRTKQGLAAAKAKGIKLGRPKAKQEAVDEAMRLYKEASMTVKQIAAATGLSEPTIYRKAKEYGYRKGYTA